MLQHDLPGYLPQYILFRGISKKKEEVVEKEEKREGEPYCKKVEVPVKSSVVSAGGEVLQGSSWSNAWHNTAEKGVSAKK